MTIIIILAGVAVVALAGIAVALVLDVMTRLEEEMP